MWRRSSGVTEWGGESDGVSGSGSEGEAFGKPLQSSFVVVLDSDFCTRGDASILPESTRR